MSLESAATAIAVKSTTGIITAAGVWSGVIVASLWIVLQVVKNRPKMKQLEIEEGESDRKGWHELIATLTEQVDRLSKQVRELSEENGLLRREIRELHNVIDGVRRENQAVQISGQRAIREAVEKGDAAEALRALPGGGG